MLIKAGGVLCLTTLQKCCQCSHFSLHWQTALPFQYLD